MKENNIVYVMYNAIAGLTKIGITADIRQRRSNIISCSGCDIEILYYTKPLTNAQALEKDILHHFKDYKTYGEWVNADPTDVVSFVKKEDEKLKGSYIYSMYNDGLTITQISEKLEVSRAHISNIFRRLGVTKNPLEKTLQEEKKSLVKRRKEDEKEFKERPKCTLDKSGKFRRLKQYLYTNDKCFKVSKFTNGYIIDEYFETKDIAEKYIKTLNN